MGPEGGLSEREAGAAAGRWLYPVTLVTEFSGPNGGMRPSCAVLQFYWGDMG